MLNKKIINISIFEPKTPPSIVKTSNGDAILDNICIKSDTDEHLFSGEYYLDSTFLIDNEGLHNHIQEEAILKVKMDYGEEYFRIASIRKNSRDIVVFARQETIAQTVDMWLEDVRPESQGGQGALSWIRDNSKGKKDIQIFSDITTLNTAYYMNMSMYKALHDCDQSFMNRWGGEIKRRGYDLTINKRIGTHRGVQIRSGKNLTGFEANTNIDTVVTRIKPKGYNGITINGYVDSPLISKYRSIKTREIKYEDVKVKEKEDDEGFDTLEEAQAELIRRADLEFSKNHIDELTGDYRVNFVQLEYTEEYKNYVQAERVYLGDEIDVYESKLDISLTVRAVRKKYDVLRQRTIEIELSNAIEKKKPPTIGNVLDKLDKVESNMNDSNKLLEEAINNATDQIKNGLKNSYVVVRENEILIMDTKDINTAMNVWRWNAGGLAHSSTGYYGTYSTAITQDGSIVANMITTGILSASLIRTGILQNADGSLQIDLSSKYGIMTKKNGKNAIELAGTILKFFDWDGLGDAIGQIFSSRLRGTDKPGLILANSKRGYSGIGYQDLNDSTIYPFYMLFDKYNISGQAPYPIMFREVPCLNNFEFHLDSLSTNSIYNSIANHFVNKVQNNFIISDKDSKMNRLLFGKNSLHLYDVIDNGNRYCFISPSETFFGTNGYKYFSASRNGFTFWKGMDDILYTTVADTIQSDRGFHINGDLTVNGNKNCIQKTDRYGERLYYSVEDCESYLTDRSMKVFDVERVVSEGIVTYERVILIDNIFKESVRCDLDYTVEIIKQGWGDFRIKEQATDYFIVESDREDFTFKFVITGKRKGFEDERNKEAFTELETSLSKATNRISDNITNYNGYGDSEPYVQNEYWRVYMNRR